MSYQVLARKYRPHTFDELVGQEHVSRALTHALDQDRLHHAYLFTGTRGVGKTTIARILSRCLNCEEGVSSHPCGVCATCEEISEGRFVDLIEVDAASRTKVEDTRELLENVQYAPTSGRYKVYLIDEVHMLSAHSFNALLKTLEEPPPHVKFLLATTDPQRLPVTVLSRCLQFSLKALPAEQIASHLKVLLEREMLRFEEPALLALSRAAQGSVRDALSLTDQAISFAGEQLTEQSVSTMLGTVDRGHVRTLLEALADGDAAIVLQGLAAIAEHAPDELALLDEVVSALHELAVIQALGGEGVDQAMAELAGRFQAEQIQLYYDVALRGRRDIQDAPDARAALEMILLRMVLFSPRGVLPGGEAQAPVKKPEAPAPSARGGQPGDLSALLGNDSQQSRAESEAIPPVAKTVTSTPSVPADAPSTPSQPEPDPPAVTEEAPPPVPLAEPHSDQDMDAWWAALVERLPLDGTVRHLARNAVLVSRREGVWTLRLSRGHQVLVNPERTEELAGALSDYFQRRLRLRLEYDADAGGTPEALDQERRQVRLQEARGALLEDATVQTLLSQFNARLDESSIQPRDSDQPTD